ncbi:uncharacterized protein C8R40DRAFT_115066 [Lentinula edodes]|uniref:uncharacterized protein n=1 Tax=Lentinula edodes TaxID=5353 RepID=UPI001E8DD604|nr:uncharacterized protein C8R40DRAFT_115066 [Lentinula edodes]KAH7876746.1 hypothetical protein C8R40DRAFT_115066 [Lentinula edodes]
MSLTHFLIICSPFFGHVRPIFAFTMNLLVMYPELHITYVTTGTSTSGLSPSFEQEMTLYGLQDEPRSRLHLELLGEGKKDSLVEQMVSLFALIPAFLEELFTPGTQQSTFKQVPSLSIIDILALPSVDLLDKIYFSKCNTLHKIPALCYSPTNAATLNLYWLRKEEYPETFWRPIYSQAEKEVETGIYENLTVDHVAYKIWCRASNIDAKTVSLPPMHHHELNPQTDSLDTSESSVVVSQAQLAISITNRMDRLNGFIIHTTPIMEPGEAEEMQHISPMHLFYHIGPQYPETWWTDGIPTEVQVLSTEDRKVVSFLDDMLDRYGENSVVYISFGTTFLPSNAPHLFDALLKTLLGAEPPLPFLFAGAINNKLLTADHREAIQKSGHGLLAGFVPQQAVLKHNATGWYLCHAGSNSVSEAFLNEVPMILWPYTMDQPLIANQLSVRLKLAYELVQVRNGESIGRPTHRGSIVEGTQEAIEEEMREIWKLMRGKDGAEMRQRVIAFSKAMKIDHWQGAARKAMEGFATFLTE